MSLLDAFSNAVYQATAGFQDYQQRIKPALDEQNYVRGERARVGDERIRAEANRILQDVHATYGGPQGAAAKMGPDIYNALRTKAGLMAIGTRDQPITETTTTERPVFQTPGPFEDVGPAPQIEVPGQPVTIPRGVSGQLGGQPIPARTASTFISPRGEGAVDAPTEPSQPTIQRDVQTRDTGQTRRVLDLPAARTYQTPQGPMTAAELKEIPEHIQKQWFPDPMQLARLKFDIANAQATHDIALARVANERYTHDTASANALVTARTAQMQREVQVLIAKWRLAMDEGRLNEAERHNREIERYQKEANQIRYLRVTQAAAHLKGMNASTLSNVWKDLNTLIKDTQKDLDAAEDTAKQALRVKLNTLSNLERAARTQLQEMVHGANQPVDLPGEPSRDPTSGALSPRQGMPAAPSGSGMATLTPPARPGAGATRGSGISNPSKVYRLKDGTSKTAAWIKSTIDTAIRNGASRDVIRKALMDDGIQPQEFGY